MARYRVSIWQPVYKVSSKDGKDKWGLARVSRCVLCEWLVNYEKSTLPPTECPECKVSHIELEEVEIAGAA